MSDKVENIKMEGVTEYCEGRPVSLTKDETSGRWIIEASNEGGYNGVSIDLNQLLVWLIENRIDIVNQAKDITRLHKYHSACRITYQGNTLMCSRHKTFEENFNEAQRALGALLGLPPLSPEDIKKDGGTIERFRSTGTAENTDPASAPKAETVQRLEAELGKVQTEIDNLVESFSGNEIMEHISRSVIGAMNRA